MDKIREACKELLIAVQQELIQVDERTRTEFIDSNRKSTVYVEALLYKAGQVKMLLDQIKLLKINI